MSPKFGSRILKDVALDNIRRMIINGELSDGMSLREEHLAKKLNMSRTPIREALRILESEGYIVVSPQRGAYIPHLTKKDIFEIFEIRLTLEPLAAAKSCLIIPDTVLDEIETKLNIADGPPENWTSIVNAGHELHDMLLQYAGNERLIETINRYRGQIRRLQAFTERIGVGITAKNEHREILNVVKKREPDLVEAFMKFHIKNTLNLLTQSLERKTIEGPLNKTFESGYSR